LFFVLESTQGVVIYRTGKQKCCHTQKFLTIFRTTGSSYRMKFPRHERLKQQSALLAATRNLMSINRLVLVFVIDYFVTEISNVRYIF